MTRCWLRFSPLALVVCALLAVPQPAAAQHRARLSRDIADRIANGVNGSTDIIVAAPDAAIDALATRYGVTVKKRVVGGAVFEATGGQIDAISQDPDVSHVAGDVPVQRMSVMTQATGADQVWAGFDGIQGFTGRGVGVAVVDSGIGPQLALKGRVVASVDFTGPNGTGRDEYGHGTHVAGIIAESGADGYSGIAPGANLINLRVIGADGTGQTSDVINAIDWAIAHKRDFNIRVINLSLGHPVLESYVDDPLCQAAERAVAAGIVVVASAGNYGKTSDGTPVLGGVVTPGNTPEVITVGALNTRGTPDRSDDVIASYSSRGPTEIDGLLKPDLVAPGNKIVAALAPGSYLARTFPEYVSGQGARAYIELSGTSMSSAVVSGAAALLLEARPELKPQEVKIALQLTSSRVANTGLIEAGAGSLNTLAAVELALDDVASGQLPVTTIAGSNVTCAGFAYGMPADGSLWSTTLSPLAFVWGVQGNAFVWGVQSAAFVWGVQSNAFVWGVQSNVLVWGVQDNAFVWGVQDNAFVWGVQSNAFVWGVQSNAFVWGVQSNAFVWGVQGNAFVWGDQFLQPDVLVTAD